MPFLYTNFQKISLRWEGGHHTLPPSLAPSHITAPLRWNPGYATGSDGWINSQECKSFEKNDAVTIKKSMTEYHHLNLQSGLAAYLNSSLWGGGG